MPDISTGCNLRACLKLIRKLGVQMDEDAGELVIRHPGHPVIRINRRRKDATRVITGFLRRLQQVPPPR